MRVPPGVEILRPTSCCSAVMVSHMRVGIPSSGRRHPMTSRRSHCLRLGGLARLLRGSVRRRALRLGVTEEKAAISAGARAFGPLDQPPSHSCRSLLGRVDLPHRRCCHPCLCRAIRHRARAWQMQQQLGGGRGVDHTEQHISDTMLN